MKLIVDVLFLTSLLLPPAVVIAGAVVLAWGRAQSAPKTVTAHPVHA